MMTNLLWLMGAALASWIATGVYLTLARTRGWGKAVRNEGPEAHLEKEGTPTMGGAPFLLVTLLLSGLWFLVSEDPRPASSASTLPEGAGWALLALILASAALGLWDDLSSLARKRGDLADGKDASTGVLARWRLLTQSVIALAFGFWATQVGVSLFGIPWLDVLGIAFIVVGSINAFNFTDGLDGLAAGVSAIILLAFLVDPVAAILLGSLLGFLWFNAHPAKLFMGGVGSEALGAAIAGLAILHGDVWRLPLLALLPVLEVLSVVVQVAYFRATGGKRLFKMSPLHHHFELSGWPETRVVLRFWVFTALAVALAVATRGTT